MEDAVSLAALNPAKALNISDMYGSISIGKCADIIIIECINKFPMVRYAIVSGALVSALGK